MSDPVHSNAGDSRLTRIVDAMLEGGKTHPEYNEETDKIVALINERNGTNETPACIGHYGYDLERVLFWDLLQHANAVIKLHGGSIAIIPTPVGHD